jgi:hypothetical protein
VAARTELEASHFRFQLAAGGTAPTSTAFNARGAVAADKAGYKTSHRFIIKNGTFNPCFQRNAA